MPMAVSGKRSWVKRYNISEISKSAQVEAVIKTVAGFHGKEVNRFNPMIEGEFPLDNSRFAGQLPPIVSSPTFAIRKKAIKIFTLEQYVETGVLSPRHSEAIQDACTSTATF
jgi:Flp pilus assembly CpaF family ATPase